MKPIIWKISLYTMSLFYILAGLNHFLSPSFYLKMMPPILPFPEALNYISGMAEIILGVLVLVPKFRALACYGIIALLVAVYPANIYMLQQALAGVDQSVPVTALWARLPIQFLFIFWAWKMREER